jgi:hypothetical protein
MNKFNTIVITDDACRQIVSKPRTGDSNDITSRPNGKKVSK